jgi:hypothetical protein
MLGSNLSAVSAAGIAGSSSLPVPFLKKSAILAQSDKSQGPGTECPLPRGDKNR